MTVLVSFNNMYKGDTADVEMSDRVQGWVNAGVVRVDGASQTGPSAAEPDHQGSVTLGTGDDIAPGDEPGEGFGSGGYGTAEGQHQD